MPRSKMDREGECALGGAVTGTMIGASVGVVLGAPGGPAVMAAFGFFGALIGGAAGALVGWAICKIAHLIEGDGHQGSSWDYAVPVLSAVRIEARPNPARVGQACGLTVHSRLEGNDDHALCEIFYTLTAEGAYPTGAIETVRNNGSHFDNWRGPFAVTWGQPHDGRLVTVEVNMICTMPGEPNQAHRQGPLTAQLRVPVMP